MFEVCKTGRDAEIDLVGRGLGTLAFGTIFWIFAGGAPDDSGLERFCPANEIGTLAELFSREITPR